jgi:hypothetical protein
VRAYLASWFASKDDIKARAHELRAAGIEVTSRWLEEKVAGTVQIQDVEDEYLRETAKVDIHDLILADTVVLNVPSAEELKSIDIPTASWARGGRHFEAGFPYAMMVFFLYMPNSIRERGTRRLILVGHKENVFHYLDDITLNGRAVGFSLPPITTFSTWEDARTYLINTSIPEHTARRQTSEAVV